jgi:hypothetical protein
MLLFLSVCLCLRERERERVCSSVVKRKTEREYLYSRGDFCFVVFVTIT